MTFNEPLVIEIASDTYAINEYGMATMYLLAGEEKALLIDTGVGLCDLRTTIAGLTDKPCQVVLTHGHLDHVGGMGAFDEVYINEWDAALARSVSVDELRRYAGNFENNRDIYNYDIRRIKVVKPVPRFLQLKEGDVFELGGRTLEVFEFPGHTRGSVAILDRKNRIVFSGDCCNDNLLGPWCSVETIYISLRKFKRLSSCFDRNYNGHLMYLDSSRCTSQPKRVVDDLLYICEAVMNGRGNPAPFEFHGKTYQKMVYGSAGLSYDPLNIREKTSF